MLTHATSQARAIGLLILALFLLPTTGRAQSAQSALDTPTMLERVLPGVVTVVVYDDVEQRQVLGPRKGSSDVAYARPLDLGNWIGSGSGFIIEHNGQKYVVTNAHVVEYAASTEGALSIFSINQTKYPMKVVGGDQFYDIAVLAFDGVQPGPEISAVRFIQREPRIGEPIYPVGNPLGDFPYTVTNGIISAKNRGEIHGALTKKHGYLQISAVTIWGNSGGPVFTADGSVVGVVTFGEVRDKPGWMDPVVHPQLNFALEGQLADKVVKDIIQHGYYRRAFFGLALTEDQNYFCAGEECMRTYADPVTIHAVMPGSPAAELADAIGATVKEVNGVEVRNLQEAMGAFENVGPGGQARVKIEQNGQERTVTLRAGTMSSDLMGKLANFMLGGYGVQASVSNGQVVLNEVTKSTTKGAPTNAQLEVEVTDLKSGKKTKAAASVLPAILAEAGGQNEMWGINGLPDLGYALRLGAMTGTLGFVTTDDRVLTLSFYNNAESGAFPVVRHLLMY